MLKTANCNKSMERDFAPVRVDLPDAKKLVSTMLVCGLIAAMLGGNSLIAADPSKSKDLDRWAAEFALKNRGYSVLEAKGAGIKNISKPADLKQDLTGYKVRLLVIGGGAVQAADVAKLAQLSNLRSLQFTGVSLSGGKLAPLASAKSSSLNELRIENCQITDEDLQHLSGLPKVWNLILNGNNIQGTGLSYLEKNSNLTQLYLNETQLDDKGLQHVKKLTSVTSLHLQKTRITDAGLLQIASMKQLKFCNLRKTAVTAEGVATLQGALPKCTIQH